MGLGRDSVVGVLGAGTMGSGIAQVAASAGHRVVVADIQDAAVARAREGHVKAYAREVEKGRLTREQADQTLGRFSYATVTGDSAAAFAPCQLVIEAIVEDLGVKARVFRSLEQAVTGDAVLATNTSSLSVTAIAAACQRPERVIGIHFFNPAQILPLVEIVLGIGTAPELGAAVRALIAAWGKTPVLASDTPGFIVNRIARPFYGEALRIFEEGIADKATIDWAMREAGFKMGPFELMDLIGNDINYAVSKSVFEAFGFDPKYRPFLTQQRLVEAGLLGKKSGRGHYDYRPGAVPPEADKDPALGSAISARVVALLINAAADALFWRVANRDDIDLAMVKGVNYPKGLLKWADELGVNEVLGRLDRLHHEYGDDRYRASPLLRRIGTAGGRFYS